MKRVLPNVQKCPLTNKGISIKLCFYGRIQPDPDVHKNRYTIDYLARQGVVDCVTIFSDVDTRFEESLLVKIFELTRFHVEYNIIFKAAIQ